MMVRGRKKIVISAFCLIFCIVVMITMVQESVGATGKDIYATWIEINALEEELESPEGAKKLLDAESRLLKCGEEFKQIIQKCEEENYQEWDIFAEVFIARNKAILDYIEALKNYEQSEKFQKYETLLKKHLK